MKFLLFALALLAVAIIIVGNAAHENFGRAELMPPPAAPPVSRTSTADNTTPSPVVITSSTFRGPTAPPHIVGPSQNPPGH